ncbi:MAG: hypothetical protein HDT39_07190 [Lachnospiraceae bacterium]|nr:hypothetical protein [Lachnospiraceae bacterium]
MQMSDFLTKTDQYIKSIDIGQKFKLNDILGEDCPAYPGAWLRDKVRKGRFNTSLYVVEFVGIDYSDTYIKKAIKKINY